MTTSTRKAIFISHANPEDNAFTIWLGARLTGAGYEVWADVLKLRGGQDWQRLLENALRNKACKVLLVGTEKGVEKQGVRNEIQIACEVGKHIGDEEFVIPLRLTNFEAPFLIVHAQYIDFKRSWADGLAELLTTLQVSANIPRKITPASETIDYWKQVHLRHSQSLTLIAEPLVSNWLSFQQLPENLYLYDFDGPITIELAKKKMKSAMWPLVPFRRGFLAFCPPSDLQDHFGPSLPLKIVDEIDTNAYLDDAWPDQRIERIDANNLFTNLVRQAMELTLRRRMLSPYEMTGGQRTWWGALDSVPSHQIAFSYGPIHRGRRQIVGYSQTRRLHWHYGITPKPRVFPFPHIRIVHRVLFTEDGRTPIANPKRMHRLRRSHTKSWRNAKWRDMLLAFLHWLSNGETSLVVPVGSEIAFSLHLPPLIVDAPVSIIVDDDAEGEFDSEDELVAEDVSLFDFDEFDNIDDDSTEEGGDHDH